jgi:hypothetical protein
MSEYDGIALEAARSMLTEHASHVEMLLDFGCAHYIALMELTLALVGWDRVNLQAAVQMQEISRELHPGS